MDISTMAPEHESPPQLSQSDRMLIDLLGRGAPDAEVAVRLGISVPELRDRIARMQARLGVSDRAGLMRLAARYLPANTGATPAEPRSTPAKSPPTPPVAPIPPESTWPSDSGDGAIPPTSAGPPEAPRYSRRKLLAIAGAAAAAGLTGGWLLTRETRTAPTLPDLPAPTPTPTFRVFPTPTPRPTPAPLDPIAEMIPTRSTLPFARGSFEPNAAIEQAHGAFFMDTGTGRIEAWWHAGLEPEASLQYHILADGRFVLARDASDNELLLDRHAQRSFLWTRERMQLVAAHASWLLMAEMRRPAPNQWPVYTGRFFLVSWREGDAQLAASFMLDEADLSRWSVQAQFSPDGRHLVVWSSFDRGVPTVRRIDPETGGETARFQFDFDAWGRFSRAGPRDMVQFERLSGDGKDLPGGHMTILRRTWDLADGPPAVDVTAAAGGDVSPGGNVVAARTWQRYVGGGDGEMGDHWGALAFVDGGGAPLFRVRSAFMDYGDSIDATRWLADGSGYVAMVHDPDAPADAPFWSRGRFAVVRADGSGIEPLPAPPAGIRERLTGWRRSPIPAPDRIGLFSLGRTALFNRNTGEWFAPDLPAVHVGHDPPWGATSEEMMFVLNNGGHGGGFPPVMLPPKIESPPYDDQFSFRVAVDTWLNLREEPSVEAEVLDTLADGAQLELADPENPQPEVVLASDGDDHLIAWAHVRTPAGTEGWVDISYLEWA